MGFRGFWTVRELLKKEHLSTILRSEALDKCGVYVVVCPTSYKPEFIDPSEACVTGNMVKPKPVEELQLRWVPGMEVLYIGKTKRPLKKRIGELIRHSQGWSKIHQGGEVLWQLRGYEVFEIGYLPRDEPKEEESRLIHQFKSKTFKLPFANRQKPRARGILG